MILPTKGQTGAPLRAIADDPALRTDTRSKRSDVDRPVVTGLPTTTVMRSERTGMIFRGLLVTALAVGLLGFFRHPTVEVDPGSTDAPPPAVLIQTD